MQGAQGRGRGSHSRGRAEEHPDPTHQHLRRQVLREARAESRRNLHDGDSPSTRHSRPERFTALPGGTVLQLSQGEAGPGELPQPTRDHTGGGDQGVLQPPQPRLGRGQASQKPATPLLATGRGPPADTAADGQPDARQEPAIDRSGGGGRARGQAQAKAGRSAGQARGPGASLPGGGTEEPSVRPPVCRPPAPTARGGPELPPRVSRCQARR